MTSRDGRRPDSRSVERRRRHGKSGGSDTSVETLIPHCNGDLLRTESDGMRKMNCVGSAQSVQDSQLAGGTPRQDTSTNDRGRSGGGGRESNPPDGDRPSQPL